MHAAPDTLNLNPPQPPGMVRALGLALVAHGLLLVALVINVQWKQSESATVEAELWSSAVQVAAPKAVAEEEAPPPPPEEAPRLAPPPPVAKVQPPPPAPDVNDAAIALERAKKKREAEKREQALQDKADKAEKAKLDKEKALKAEKTRKAEELAKNKAEAEAEKKRADDKRAKDKKAAQDKQDALDKKAKATQDAKEAAQKAQTQADAKAQAAQRDANLKRMAGLAGATGGANASGNALQSSGPSSGYGGRVSAKVKPNIVFTDTFDGNPAAEVEVRSAADGSILSRKLLKSSGNKGWDDAVLKAIDKTETMPRDTDGRVPSPMILTFRPIN